MKLCLGCRRLFESEATYCGHCDLPFVRRCSEGHPNPRGTGASCLTCGLTPLSEAVSYCELAWFTLPLGVLGAIGGWRWCCHHPLMAIGLGEQAGLWGLGLIFDVAPSRVRGFLVECLSLYVLIWGASYLLPGQGGQKVRQGLQALLKQVKAGIKRIGKGAWKAITMRQKAKK